MNYRDTGVSKNPSRDQNGVKACIHIDLMIESVEMIPIATMTYEDWAGLDICMAENTNN